MTCPIYCSHTFGDNKTTSISFKRSRCSMYRSGRFFSICGWHWIMQMCSVTCETGPLPRIYGNRELVPAHPPQYSHFRLDFHLRIPSPSFTFLLLIHVRSLYFFLRTTVYTDFNVYTQQRLKRGQKSACFVQPVLDATSQDSSVSTVLGATIRISNPGRKKCFSILHYV
jgi:hypothetical protein